MTEIPDSRSQGDSQLVFTRLFVANERAFSTELRKRLVGQKPDRAKLLALGRRYGELDGELSWLYAMAFAKVNRTLTPEQRNALGKLRNLEGYECAPYYIYSRGATDMPMLGDVVGTFFD